MQAILSNIKIQINEKLFVKDPESSALGKKILHEGILLLHDIGFDAFTFKKLGEKLGSNESSVYRYFENKHKLLIYLSSWYWSWLEYRMVISISNFTNPKEKLVKATTILTQTVQDDVQTKHINEAILNKVIIAEYTKTLHSKEIDHDIADGFYHIYERLINRLATIISEVNMEYKFPKSLASDIIQGAMQQHYIKNHLQSTTNCDATISPTEFYLDMIEKILK